MLQPLPPDFKLYVHSFEFTIDASEEAVWTWLKDTQVWPYKVEFYSPNESKVPNGFYERVLTNHTGPMVNFAGKLVKIEPN